MIDRPNPDGNNNVTYLTKMDVMGQWIETNWMPSRVEQNLMMVTTYNECVNEHVLARFDHTCALPQSYRYVGMHEIPCPVVTRINGLQREGKRTYRAGAFVYTFQQQETDVTTEVLITSTYFSDHGQIVCLATVPEDFAPVWAGFVKEVDRIVHARKPEPRVTIIGGRSPSFVPTVEWDDIILPEDLKADLLDDVTAFFDGGIDVYKRLKLKPFRKLLLTGVPGTGKTMICSALAKWAIDRQYPVIYVSSAGFGGSTFNKIENAISMAANSQLPVLIILEELDAYLHADEKAVVLNVLDGVEAASNDYGTLLITTTNYPEAIDERVLKRPGRLDRIFVIPQVKGHDHAERMLKHYLGEMWRDEHRTLVPQLVGFPGAFIREVAVYALTQVIYQKGEELTLEALQQSFASLRDQIKARDDFLTDRKTFGYRAS